MYEYFPKLKPVGKKEYLDTQNTGTENQRVKKEDGKQKRGAENKTKKQLLICI